MTPSLRQKGEAIPWKKGNRFLRRSLAMAHKELLHMIRDVRVLYLALGMPVIMLVLFGFAVSTDVDHVLLSVVDQDQTAASRRLVQSLLASDAFERSSDAPSAEVVASLLQKGHVKAVLVIPQGFQRDQARGVVTNAQLLVDGSNGTVATIALGYAAGAVQSVSAGKLHPVRTALSDEPAVRTRFNPAMRSAYSIVPGLVALILSMVTSLLTALTVAREWERGSMEQLFATPISRAEIVFGKLIPYAGLGFVQTLLVLTLGSYMFDIPIEGSLVTLFGCSALFLVSMLAVGLFVSVTTKNQQVSVLFALMLSYMPAALLSGFLYPIENMAWPLRALSVGVPARYYIAALRGILLKGNGVAILWPKILALAGFAAVTLSLAVAQFRRRLG
jgi:ABC-2 type transport system permease protein